MSFQTTIYNKSPLFFQTILLNIKAFELYLERYGKKFWRLFEEFDNNQWLSSAELEAYQNEKLRILIRHAYESVPYYRTCMDKLKLTPKDFKTRDDLHKLPVLKRDDIKKNLKSMISTSYPKFLLRHGHTSGTTGSPLEFLYDIKTCVVHLVAVWRQRYWAGATYSEPHASLQGRVIVPLDQNGPPFWRKNYINNQLFLSSFHLKEQNLPHYVDKLRKESIKVIEGYPSNLYIFALYLLKHGESSPMKAVLTSSETLFDYQREAIEKAFETKIFDFYGLAERTVFASQCSEHTGHHLNSDYGITEFIDSAGQPVNNGNLGGIVTTSLHNFAMPFIRYETNDSSAFTKSKCPCGRAFPLMEDVTTKNESIITHPDGRLISPSVLTHPFKPMHNVIESQIIQEEIDELIVKIVKNEHFGKEDERKLLSAFNERLGDRMRITVRYVDSIPREKSGKFRWVISNITPCF